MSDPFDIQRIRPSTTDGIPRTSKKHTGIQKEDIATESSIDAIKKRQDEKRRKGHGKEREKDDTSQDSDSQPTEGIIDIVI